MNRRPKQISRPIETGQDSGTGHAVKNLLKVEKARQHPRLRPRNRDDVDRARSLRSNVEAASQPDESNSSLGVGARDEAVTDTGENTPGKLEGKITAFRLCFIESSKRCATNSSSAKSALRCIGSPALREEAVAATRNGFHKTGTFGRITEGIEDFVDRLIDSVIEIHKRVCGP
jgi:hypothetical protein